MSVRIGLNVQKSVLGFLALLSVSIGLTQASQAENLDILRSIPLEVSGYASGKAFPEKFTSTEQVIQALNSTPVLLVHMEAIRRAYHDMPITEHDKLLTAIHKRRMTNEKDLMLGFDHGYAELVFKQNKTGLFFLRKANDYFRDQFSALAYGMAEVEADINLEDSTPDTMTTRKLDAIFQLGDAVKRDSMKHQPGFWPSYLKVIEVMKPMPSYKSFSSRDFSLVYVPYGNSVVPLKGITTASLPANDGAPLSSLTDAALGTSCSPEPSPLDESTKPFTGVSVAQHSANFSGNNALVQYFQAQEPSQYRVRVTGQDGKQLATFKTSVIPRRSVEDLDGDGVHEIVVRQYAQNPTMPVIVYRYTPCGLELDKKIYDSFQ